MIGLPTKKIPPPLPGMIEQDRVMAGPWMQSGNPVSDFLVNLYRQTRTVVPIVASPPVPSPGTMAKTPGPIKAATPKRIAAKRADILKQIP